MSAVVYIARNEMGEVLYVGCTTQFEGRMSNHRSTSAWYSDATRIDVEGFDSVEAARRTEKSYIQQWSPPFNVQHAGRRAKRMANVNQQLATVLLERPLVEYVAEKREARPRWAWTLIAEQLASDTDGRVNITGESLRQWYGADVAA